MTAVGDRESPDRSLLIGDSPDGTTNVELPFLDRESATRRVVVALYLRPTLAARLYQELCRPGRQALAPSPGLDMPLIARNAAAIQRNRVRELGELSIAAIALFLLAVVAVLQASFYGAMSAWPFAAAGLVITVSFFWFMGRAAGEAWELASIIMRENIWDPGPGLLDENQEWRLDRVNHANVCVYHPYRDDEFVGLGEHQKEQVMPPVDITRADESDLPVVAFSASDLHEHIAGVLSEVENGQISGRNVLYIKGSWAHNYRDLYPGGTRIPAVDVPSGVVRATSNRPSEGARTYLCCQVISHGGLLVNTVNVRFKLVNGELSWDISTLLLRPVALEYLDYLVALERGRWRLRSSPVSAGLRRAGRRYLRALVGAPAALVRNERAEVRAQQILQPNGRRRRKDDDSAPGAWTSLRERMQGDQPLNHIQRIDVTDNFQRLLRAVFSEVATFLEEHHVHVAELLAAQSTVIQNILARNLSIGDHNAVGDREYQHNQKSGSPQDDGA